MLAIDIGNSNVVLGLFRGRRLAHSWRVATRSETTSDEVGLLLEALLDSQRIPPRTVGPVAIASVVPTATAVWRAACLWRLGAEPLVVGPETDTGLRIDTDDPGQVGADRLVDALAAWRTYGAPVVVVDFGTATTVDAVARGGVYLGGAIAPGVGIAAEALFTHAARLPRVELRRPPRAIGRNTVHGMQAGILFGYAGQVDALVRKVRRELGGSARVVATGGMVDLLAEESRTIEVVDRTLTLQGLRLIAQRARRAPEGSN